MIHNMYKMQDTRYRIQDTGYRIQDTQNVKDAGYRKHDIR